jgi:exosome complex component CSL4
MDRVDGGDGQELKKNLAVLPGDRLAVSEEFLPGPHTYDDSGLIRALVAGKVRRDTKNMEISVEPVVKPRLIAVGDVVAGQVEATQASAAAFKIYYLNGKPTDKDFSGSLSLRSGRPGRGGPRGPPVKLGDVVRCKVISRLNGIIHLTINEEELGVVYALCGTCGRPLLRGGNKAKCDECGNVEERKLASDFGNSPFQL